MPYRLKKHYEPLYLNINAYLNYVNILNWIKKVNSYSLLGC